MITLFNLSNLEVEKMTTDNSNNPVATVASYILLSLILSFDSPHTQPP